MFNRHEGAGVARHFRDSRPKPEHDRRRLGHPLPRSARRFVGAETLQSFSKRLILQLKLMLTKPIYS